METKINIAEILKDKPVGIKLYSSTFGYIKFNGVHKDKVYFSSEDTNAHSVKSNGKMYDGGECIIFPSKEMRNWSKFSWKKGDVLVGVGQRIIFEKFIDENYTKFQGKYSLSTYEDRTLVVDKRCYTSYFRKLDDSVNVKNYFKEIEERLGGKLNRETLEVEKALSESKEILETFNSRCQIIKLAYLSNILPKDIINNKFDKKKLRMVMRRKIGDIYKAKIDSYNSYYQYMKLLGEVDEVLSLDEWEKKHRKWL